MRKKIVMYFLKRPLDKDPFSTFGKKREVYHSFFREGSRLGFHMFVASGKENYEAPMMFKNVFEYADGIFLPAGTIHADAIFDRSGGLSFPREGFDSNILNTIAFKRLCNDKNATYGILSDCMPKNFTIHNENDLSFALGSFGNGDIVVFKPSNGMQGKGIIIGPVSEIRSVTLEPEKEYSLQEFIDTSFGIPGIVAGEHDLRVIIANGTIVLSHVRTPKHGSLLANVAQGGSIREIPVRDIPRSVLDTVRLVQERIDSVFGFPLYSIDFGLRDGNHPFIFELNDQIGFPSEQMTYAPFIETVLESLRKRCT